MINSIEIYIDGACQPNPGSGGIGIYVKGSGLEERFSIPLNGTVAKDISKEFRKKIILSYIPREENSIADSLAKDGIKK